MAKDAKSSKQHLSTHLFMAATSAAFAEVLTFPIDTMKVYLQLQTKLKGLNPHLPTELEIGSAHSGLKSGHSHHNIPLGITNLVNTVREIYSQSGLRGFYRGWKPAVLRATLNNALSATIYKPVRRKLGFDHRNCPLYIKLSSGFLTGSCTQIIAAPTDLLKVRLQADAARDRPRYTDFTNAIRTIYNESGWRAFYRGLGPAMGRAGFSVAATLGTYDHCKYFLLEHRCILCRGSGVKMFHEKDIRLHVACSLCSGFFATVLASPFDVVKTRYQSQDFINPIYKSARHCLEQIVKNDGVMVLFRGFIPMYARLGPWQITFFVTYEFLHHEVLGQSF